MRLAVNYSRELAELIRCDRIAVDLIKCPAWPEVVGEAVKLGKTYVHFPFCCTSTTRGEAFDNNILPLLSSTQTIFINTHIEPPQPSTCSIDAFIADAVANIMALRFRARQWRVRLGKLPRCVAKTGTIIAENCPPSLIPGTSDQSVLEASWVKQIVETADVGFLLDIGHARLSAALLGQDTKHYIQQLPVRRIRELHITGIGVSPAGRKEDHCPLTDADWELFEWVLGNIRYGTFSEPEVVAFEYGGIGELFSWRSEGSVLANQVPKLFSMVNESYLSLSAPHRASW